MQTHLKFSQVAICLIIKILKKFIFKDFSNLTSFNFSSLIKEIFFSDIEIHLTLPSQWPLVCTLSIPVLCGEEEEICSWDSLEVGI